MGIRKDTRVENYRMIHTWADPEHNFKAEVRREDGLWLVDTGQALRTVQDYKRAVDIVMDDYRLTKAGLDSWEDKAREMAEKPWEELSDYEQHDLIGAARLMERGV